MSTKGFGYIQYYIILKYKGMTDLSKLQHFVGCDVSKDYLDFALYRRGIVYNAFDHIRVDNSVEGFQQMRKWLRSLGVDLKKGVIAMEHTGSYSTALSEWCFKKKITFVFLHPQDVKNACTRGRNKTDRDDACFIADYVYTMREKLQPSMPEPSVIGRLRRLRNERNLAVKSRTSYMNQAGTVTDKGIRLRMLKIVDVLTSQIKEIETEIKNTVDSDESMSRNYSYLLSIPGIGMQNAVATIIATWNFTRFQTSRQYAKFCCVSPLSRESGSSVRSGDHVVKAGHNELKSLLTDGARSAIQHDANLRSYYERKRAEGKMHGCVMNAVKFKLICRMFAVIRRQTPYVNTEGYRA